MARSFTKLTRPGMRALQVGDCITERGITFQRLENGDGLFSINIMVHRKRIHRNVGRESEGITRTTAEEFIAKVRREAQEGRLNLPKRRKVALTIASATPLYLERLRQEGGKEVARKTQRLEQYIVPFLGGIQIDKITTFDVQRYKQHRLAQPVRTRKRLEPDQAWPTTRPATINRELATLSQLLRKASEWGWIDRKRAEIRQLNEDNERTIYLTPDQAERLLEAAKHDRNPQIYAFILIGLRTAMRKSEILSIRREDVHLEKRTVYIPAAKAGARNQPITADLSAFLSNYMKALPAGTPWLFPSVDAKLGHTVDVRKAFVRVVEAAGLDSLTVTPHTLRHTAITHLVQARVDLPTVKRISGHKTMVMMERYSHQSGSHIAEAMDKLDERYRSGKKP